MEDEFLVYLDSKIGRRLVSSFEHADLLLWGARDEGSVTLLGLTLAIGAKDPENTEELDKAMKNLDDIIEMVSALWRDIDLTFFIVFYSLSGGSIFRITSSGEVMDLSRSILVEENKMPATIEALFGTDFGTMGTAKPVNKSTSDWFHVWTRANLPLEYVKANIDGLILDQKGKPCILLETKRSSASPSVWKPYQTDSRNYYLQNLMAKKAGLDFWTVYHVKGVTVNDSSEIALFLVSDVSLSSQHWITYERRNLKAAKVIELLEETCNKRTVVK